MRRLAFPAVILAGAALGIALPGASAAQVPVTRPQRTVSLSDPVPHCQPVLITTPWRTFTVKACDSGLRDPAPGMEWAWTVDGSAIKGGAVIFGAQIPRQR